MLKIGVIGFGARITGIVNRLLESGEVELTAVMDIRINELKEKFLKEGIYKNVTFYTDADEMLQNEKLDGVCIGTRCSMHTEYALLASKYDVAIFLEKPVSTTEEDLERLKKAEGLSDRFVVSFPLRKTRMVTYVKELIVSGKIGKIEHIQAYNNVPYGRGYYHKWYRDENETGGLFLQKATHDFDYINYLLEGKRPKRICAMKSKQVFKGNKPAGLLCKACTEQKVCPESPENVRKTGDPYSIGEYCCFAVDTGNEDSGSAIIEYDNGMHVVYSQNFIVRKGAGKRGARLIGYYGTIEFDFVSGIVKVFHHMENIVETHEFAKQEEHFGGDAKLANNFIDVMKGSEKSSTTLKAGILSAAMCLAAKKSAAEHKFVEIE